MSAPQYTPDQLAAAARISVALPTNPDTGRKGSDALDTMVTADTLKWGRVRETAELVLGRTLDLTECDPAPYIRAQLRRWAVADLAGAHRYVKPENRTIGPVPDPDAGPACVECGEEIPAGDVHSGHGMCASCLHDARRSGWTPGDDE